MKKKVLLHLGFQKTGTTSIQKLLQANTQSLRDLVSYPYGIHTHPLRWSSRRFIGSSSSLELKTMEYLLRGYFAEILSTSCDVAIISDENILGRVLYDGNGDILKWSSRILPLIEKTLPAEMNAEIVFYTRDHERWLKSLHSQCIKRAGETRSYSHWIESCPVDTSWEHMKTEMSHYAGSIPVHFERMEDDLLSHNFVGPALLRRAGIEDSVIRSLNIPDPQNTALHPVSLQVQRLVNCLPIGSRKKISVSERIEKLDRRLRV